MLTHVALPTRLHSTKTTSVVLAEPKAGQIGELRPADLVVRIAKPRLSGLARALASRRGASFQDVAHSLLTKSNGVPVP